MDRYKTIRNMNYIELRNYLRPKKNIDKYAQLFKELRNSCLYIKDALQIYKNIPQVEIDENLSCTINKLNTDTEYILIYISNLTEFFIK